MTWPAGYGRRVLDEVDSTNAEAVRIAPGLTGPEWILGLRQTKGRGRRGRPWRDPEGNLAATLVLRPQGPPSHVALLSFVAALALHDACSKVTGRPQSFALKWPNDVLLNGHKLAGILLESTGAGTGVAHLAIGIGVNLRAVPEAALVEPGALRPVALMSETGIAIPPEEFLDFLAAAFATRKALFDAQGFAPIREAWLARAARLGEEVTARTLRSTMTGRFETMDESGNLVLLATQGRVAIPAADIFFERRDDASDN